MARGYFLGEREAAELRQLADKLRKQLANTAGRPGRERGDHQAPEVYVARTPTGGIPALQEAAGVSIEDVPGSADCRIYRVLTGPVRLAPIDGSSFKTVYNLGHDAIGGNRWVIVWRDKFGDWFASTPFPRPSETDTGTGTDLGTATDLPCGSALFYVYRYRCEASAGTSGGDLNEYRQLVRVAWDGMGCLSRTVGAETYVQTIACCDPDCATAEGAGTGTGTGTEAGDTGEPLTTCCETDLIPLANVFVTVSGSDCPCFASVELPRTVDNPARFENFGGTNCGQNTYQMALYCQSPGRGVDDWRLDYDFDQGAGFSGCSGTGTVAPEPGSTCDPFHLTFLVPIAAECCEGSPGGFVTLTITS